MSTLSATTSVLTHSLAWALLHSLWQGIMIYVCLFVLLKALPNISSRIKYYLSFSTFTALFVWFADTWVTQYQRMKGITVYITQPHFDSLPVTTYTIKTTPVVTSSPSLINQLLHSIEQYIPSVIPIYLAGLAFMLFRFLINIYQLKALRTQGICQPETKWNDLLLQWQKQFEITRPVKLFLSNRINVPMMLGTLKPIILLPIATINHLTTEQVEAILLHELAHIKRHDYLLNIFQTIAETILFFNPFVWLISGIIRRQREDCCDDLVVANTASPLPYANALAILEHNRINETRLTLAATGNRNQLLSRIKRIMDMKKSRLPAGQLTIIIVLFLSIALTVAMITFTTSFAQKAKTNKSESTKKSIDQPNPTSEDKLNNNNSIKVTKEDSTAAALKFKNPGYSEDTAIIRFMMKDSTSVWVRLADRPLDERRIIKEKYFSNKNGAIDWDELKADLRFLITKAYKNINNPRLKDKIEADIDKNIHELSFSFASRKSYDSSMRWYEDENRKRNDKSNFVTSPVPFPRLDIPVPGKIVYSFGPTCRKINTGDEHPDVTDTAFWANKMKIASDNIKKLFDNPNDSGSWNYNDAKEKANKELEGTEWEKIKYLVYKSDEAFIKCIDDTKGFNLKLSSGKAAKIEAENTINNSVEAIENAPNEVQENHHVANIYLYLTWYGYMIALRG